jgi:molecular chaperone DnaK (HSP70)
MLVAVRVGEEDPDPTIPIGDVDPWMPSLVGIDDQGSYLFGEAADQLRPDQVVRSIKTLLGANKETVSIGRKEASGPPQRIDDLIEMLFREALRRARENAGPDVRPYLEPPFPVHLCCPANWTAEPRRRLGEIAKRAGLKASPDEIVDEPIAAGVSWVMGLAEAGEALHEGRTLVFDYGGGTLDVAVLEVARPPGASRPDITVLAADALPYAGDRLDERIFDGLKPSLTNSGWSGDQDEVEKDQLTLRAARELKHALSNTDEAEVRIPGFDGPVRYTRRKLEAAFRPQLHEAMEFVFNVIKASVARQRNANYQQIRVSENKSQKKEIDHILLAGGMSRIPCVSEELRGQLGKDPFVDLGLVDPEKSVVSGLTFEDAVTGLNVHRPGFGFVAEYLNAQGENIGEQVLYEAFSPLYKKYEPFIQLTDLGVRTVLEPPAGAQSVKMVCRGISGRKVPLRLGEKIESGIELPLSMHRGHRTQQFFKLYVDGRIILSAKRHAHFWFPRWPILRDGLAAELQVKSQKPRRPWYNPDIDVAVASRHRR